MTEQSQHSNVEVMRWFTGARNIQLLIGKPPGGGTYPGGPYTVTQVLGAAGFFLVAQITQPVWGMWSWLVNNVILAIGTLAVLFGLRVVKPGGRNPVMAATSILAAATASTTPRFGGKPIQYRRPYQVRNAQIRVLLDPLPTTAEPAVAPARPEERALVVDLAKHAAPAPTTTGDVGPAAVPVNRFLQDLPEPSEADLPDNDCPFITAYAHGGHHA